MENASPTSAATYMQNIPVMVLIVFITMEKVFAFVKSQKNNNDSGKSVDLNNFLTQFGNIIKDNITSMLGKILDLLRESQTKQALIFDKVKSNHDKMGVVINEKRAIVDDVHSSINLAKTEQNEIMNNFKKEIRDEFRSLNNKVTNLKCVNKNN